MWLARRVVWMCGVALVLGCAVYWMWSGSVERDDAEFQQVRQGRRTVVAMKKQNRDLQHVTAVPSAKKVKMRPPLDPEARRKLISAIAQAHRSRLSKEVASRSSHRRGQGDVKPLALKNHAADIKPWEKQGMATLNQLLAECIDLVQAEVPELTGNIGIGFRISGEPGVGAVVDKITFDDAYTTIKRSDLRECIQESLYALELDAPADGGSIERMITLKIRPDDPSAIGGRP